MIDTPAKPFSTFPVGAHEEIIHYHKNGAKELAYYYIDDEIVWRRNWDEEGRLDIEQSYRKSRPHGIYRRWHENGVLYHETYYLYGNEHGISRQYDDDGILIGTYVMVHGTGIDQWYEKLGDDPVTISEEREYKNGYPHGIERWYWCSPDENKIWLEKHFQWGEDHGIFREWNKAGRLCRGFPQYYINGKKVDKRRYLTACKQDLTLPPYRSEDNDWHREPLVP